MSGTPTTNTRIWPRAPWITPGLHYRGTVDYLFTPHGSAVVGPTQYQPVDPEAATPPPTVTPQLQPLNRLTLMFGLQYDFGGKSQ